MLKFAAAFHLTALLTVAAAAGCAADSTGEDASTAETAGAVIGTDCKISSQSVVDEGAQIHGEGGVSCTRWHGYRLHVQLERMGAAGFWERVTSEYDLENGSARGLELEAATDATACVPGDTYRVQTTVYRPAPAVVPPELWEKEILRSEPFTCGAPAAPVAVDPTAAK